MKKCKQDSNCRSGSICDERYKVRSKYFSLKNNDLFFNWLYWFFPKFLHKKYCKRGCKEDKECQSGFSCYNLRCLQTCQIDSHCPKDKYCHLDHQVCHSLCRSSTDCSSGYGCQESRCLKVLADCALTGQQFV